MRPLGQPLIALLLLASFARAEEPRTAPLARYFPAKDLVAYVEFDGLDAHAEAWKKTAAWKILNETPTGAMLDKVARQLLVPTLSDVLATADDFSSVARQLVRSGFAFGINRKIDDPLAKPSCIGLVVRGGGKGPLIPTIDKYMARIGGLHNALSMRDGVGGREISVLGEPEGPGVAWWTEGDDLAICFMDSKYSEVMIAALEGRQPNAVEHPLRKELAASSDGFEPVGLAFFDARALPEMPAEAKIFGLDGIKRVDVRWGYRGEALESLTRVVAPSPRKGVLALFDQPTFDAKSLPPLPAGVGSFASTSIDLVKVFDQVAALAKVLDKPLKNEGDPVNEVAELIRISTGRRLREDILAGIGPRFLVADVPTHVLMNANPFDGFARNLARVLRLSLLVEIKDKGRLLQDLDALARWANDHFKDPKASDKPAPPLVRRLKNVENGYEIALSQTYWPLPAGYRPSIVVGENFLSFATTPDVARQALRGNGELDGAMTRVLADLPADLTLLSVTDTRNSALPEVLANVPSLIQWWGFAIQGVIQDQATPLAHVRRTVTAFASIKTRRKPSVTALMLYDHRKTATYWAR